MSRERRIYIVYTCVNSEGKTKHIASTGDKAVSWCRRYWPDELYEVFAIVVDEGDHET